jgi:hypothetical protein
MTNMAHRIAHFADKAHLGGHTLSAIIVGLIGGGLFACVLGALVYDIGRALPSRRPSFPLRNRTLSAAA